MAAKEESVQPAAGAKGHGGKGKFKGKTVDLHELLADQRGSAQPLNWADAVEQESVQATTTTIEVKARIIRQRADLPTAPRASRDTAVDAGRVAQIPPWISYIGNVPFDADEHLLEEFLRKNDVKCERVHMARDSGGHPKGFAYALFMERAELIKALGLNQEVLINRELKIDLPAPDQLMQVATKRFQWKDPDEDPKGGEWVRAGGRHQNRNIQNYGTSQNGQQQGGPGARMGGYQQPQGQQYQNQPPAGRQQQQRYGDQYGRQQNYSQQRMQAQDYGGYNDHYGQQQQVRMPPQQGYNNTLPRQQQNRGYRGPPGRNYEAEFDPRMPRHGQFPPEYYGPSDNYGRYPDGYQTQQQGYGGYQQQQYSRGGPYGQGGRYDGRYEQRGGYQEYHQQQGYYDDGYNYGRNRGAYQQQGYDRRGGEVQGNYRGERQAYGYRDQHDHRDREEPTRTRLESATSETGSETEKKERKKLELKPRTKPIGSVDEENEDSGARKSIFGGAKPVDTAQREKEIEEKILKEREELHKKAEEEKAERVGRRTRTTSQISATSGAESEGTGGGPIRILTRSRSSASEKSTEKEPVKPDWDENINKNDVSAESEETVKEEDGKEPVQVQQPPQKEEKPDVTEQKLRPERSGQMPANQRGGFRGQRNPYPGNRGDRGDSRPFRDDSGRGGRGGGRGGFRGRGGGGGGNYHYDGPPQQQQQQRGGRVFTRGGFTQRPPRQQQQNRGRGGGGRGPPPPPRHAAGREASPITNGKDEVASAPRAPLKMEELEEKPVDFTDKNVFSLLDEDVEE